MEEEMTLVKAMTKANEAFGSDNYEESVKLYTKCMSMEPSDARHQLSRARAYVKLGDYLKALEDTSAVISRLPKSSSAHQLKGEALYHCEEFEAALEAFKTALDVATARAKPNIEKWIEATQTCINGGKVDAATLKPISAAANAKDKGYVPAPPPAKRIASESEPARPSAPVPARNDEDEESDDDIDFQPTHPTPGGSNRAANAMARPGPSVRAADLKDVPFTAGVPLEANAKYRWQFFQTDAKANLQVFVKKLNKNADRVKVDVQPDRIVVEVKDEECKEVEYTVSEALYARVKPEETRVSILSTQVEICMVKEEANVNWPTLQKSDIKVASNWSDPQAENIKKVYPTSAKKAKDWDKVVVEVKEEEKNENLEGDQALQRLFKQIYSNADEDTRRAMNKSFQESNGTVLSTNWKEVGAKEITCTPPEGVKLNKFES